MLLLQPLLGGLRPALAQAPLARMISVVWFKRDLRVTDHAPLREAARHGPVLPVYLFEPDLLAQPDASPRHLGFVLECLDELETRLAALGSPLQRWQGEATRVLAELHTRLGPFRLFSHEETGNLASYRRDRDVARWCRAHAIEWQQWPSAGVVRQLHDRDAWSTLWVARMTPPPLAAPDALQAPPALSPSPLRLFPGEAPRGLAWHPDALPDQPGRQTGGRQQARRLARHFFDQHLPDYRKGMSSPLSAGDTCSRLSPYLAFGCVSVQEVIHAVWRRRAELQALPPELRPRGHLAGLKSFESRLHWHCHFIQKLESEPTLETQEMHGAFAGLRDAHFSPERLTRWCRGETGFPLIDACMAMLRHTGWINFRMRALLVAFSSYQLWQPWQRPALHLAREFLDYEPGIHYPQVQMQSGTTGINTLRIYNPVKQARDQDPDGRFVRQWLPALARLPDEWLFEPWNMPRTTQQRVGLVIGRDYPEPLVDHEAAARHARDTLWALRKDEVVRREARTVYEKHGSRNPAREGAPRKRRSRQTTATDSALQLGLDFG
ncbi:deoxyribodipyrimidine photo-lyase [Zoogloea sp.]|uniref:FAD-binding domain-containing protein n=1 Tax=Zoogloea sp. TaxID=49181 RepID=UPI002606272B|nr:deoxyribodipyrimidine photo-lyase [Zoogloea sp.]MDD3354689.1 deoxyribodipyrimidine photo-lyase [Zoogloea sp.]